MRKFGALLKKELMELVTIQMILPLLLGVMAFAFIGNIIGGEAKKASQQQDIMVLDLDQSAFSKSLIQSLAQSNFKIKEHEGDTLDAVTAQAKQQNISIVLSIPQGFEAGVQEGKPLDIDTYTILKNFSATGASSSQAVKGVIEAINQFTSNQLITAKIPDADPDALKNPVKTRDHVIVGEKQASIGASEVSGFIMSQTMLIPIIMFMIIVFSSQMIAVAIASEKENKTLETLLSTPISRASLVTAKMMAAGLVSLVMAGVYMLGFRYYMNGITGGAINEAAGLGMSEAVKQLGLVLDVKGYVLLGLSLFLSILIALAISIILGAFAEDVKKVQGLIAPIIFLPMIPYIVSMIVDINSVSPALRYFIYAIPFSHPFLASPNLFLHRYDIVLYGILYQAVVFTVFVIIAGRIFSSDKILTMKLNFNRRAGA